MRPAADVGQAALIDHRAGPGNSTLTLSNSAGEACAAGIAILWP
jgi:hypothetical protein